MTGPVPMLPPPPHAFVLLDDARPGGLARLYSDPVGEIAAYRPGAVRPALEAVRQASRLGRHVAGYVGYEAGHALEPVLAPLARSGDTPLLWFGVFNDMAEITSADVPTILRGGSGQSVGRHGAAMPQIDEAAHAGQMARILDYIRAGDIYQANLTLPAKVPLGGDPLAAYAAIRPHAAMAHGALVRHGGRHILCFSPESFFSIDGETIAARPMKGTAPRGADAAADAALAARLSSDMKQRAENLMIVDLIRNDLSRICLPGSIAVPELFTVETFPTVHQMTSLVTGQLMPGCDAVEALMALFPCGSVTGAPKIRAMQIIAEIERRARGVYTGTIGSIDPDGNARFNVAIRTISLAGGAEAGTMGVGSGIVADSIAADEWREVLDKTRFLKCAQRGDTR